MTSDRIRVLVMGTSDLVKELRAQHTESRSNLNFALQQCVLAARSLGLASGYAKPSAIHVPGLVATGS